MNLEMLESQPVPEIDTLREEIDRLDAEILALVKRRAEVSRPSARPGWRPVALGWYTAGR